MGTVSYIKWNPLHWYDHNDKNYGKSKFIASNLMFPKSQLQFSSNHIDNYIRMLKLSYQLRYDNG